MPLIAMADSLKRRGYAMDGFYHLLNLLCALYDRRIKEREYSTFDVERCIARVCAMYDIVAFIYRINGFSVVTGEVFRYSKYPEPECTEYSYNELQFYEKMNGTYGCSHMTESFYHYSDDDIPF